MFHSSPLGLLWAAQLFNLGFEKTAAPSACPALPSTLDPLEVPLSILGLGFGRAAPWGGGWHVLLGGRPLAVACAAATPARSAPHLTYCHQPTLLAILAVAARSTLQGMSEAEIGDGETFINFQNMCVVLSFFLHFFSL